MKQLPYSEGSVFLVPLRSGGYARGVVARATKRGRIALGYFFGPILESAQEVGWSDLDPIDAILCIRFGDLGLMNRAWPVVGTVQPWERSIWPMPEFVRRDDLSRKAWIVRYADDDPTAVDSEQPTPFDSPLRRDSVAGYGFVEEVLTERLSPLARTTARMRADDAEALRRISLVANTGRLHSIRNYLYFADRQAAKRVAAILGEKGFLVEDRLAADNVNWLVLATVHAIPAEEAVHTLITMFEQMADEYGGEYDGWEVDV